MFGVGINNSTFSSSAPRWVPSLVSGLAVLIWMSVIFGFSAENGQESGHLSQWVARMLSTITRIQWSDHLVRKLAHGTIYCCLAILLFCFLATLRHWRKLSQAILSVVIAAAYAGTDEFHQSFVAGRGPQITDVLIDSCGAIVGVLLALAFVALRNHRSKRAYHRVVSP